MLQETGHKVIAVIAEDPAETAGVNDRAQLAEAEAALRRRINRRWMRDGVTMVDPAGPTSTRPSSSSPTSVCCPARCSKAARWSAPARSSAPTRISPTTWSARAQSCARRVASEVEIGDDCRSGRSPTSGPGPASRRGAKVGTFVEIKNSDIGEGTKVPHLSYVGDAEIGAGANLGAGTITANYDGREKHRTKIGEGCPHLVHTVLVAPVEVGDGAYTGAGAVVTHDVPARAMAKGVPAEIDEGWVDRREADKD